MPTSPTRDLIAEEASHLDGARARVDADKANGSTASVSSRDSIDHAQQQVQRVVTIQHYEQILDATLRNVDLALLLPEILVRVQALLEADEATIFLLDEAGRGLYATASVGLEQAVEAGIRIPVGKGIAGSVIATGQSKTLYEITRDTVANPLLVEMRT